MFVVAGMAELADYVYRDYHSRIGALKERVDQTSKTQVCMDSLEDQQLTHSFQLMMEATDVLAAPPTSVDLSSAPPKVPEEGNSEAPSTGSDQETAPTEAEGEISKGVEEETEMEQDTAGQTTPTGTADEVTGQTTPTGTDEVTGQTTPTETDEVAEASEKMATD